MPLQARVLDRLTALTEWARRGTIRLAVTGLSQSGKTAFITSLVQNLLGAAEQSARLTPEDDGPPQFPLRETVTALAADPPRWPASTIDMLRLPMALEFLPNGLLGRGRCAELRLEILDYPGEWLLDLPLLRQSYGEWSRATLALARRGVRAALARDWLDHLARYPADRAADPEAARDAHHL